MLLVLDNFEHLDAEAAILEAGLLQSMPAAEGHRHVARAPGLVHGMVIAARRACRARRPRIRTDSKHSMRRACSCRRRSASNPHWSLRWRRRRSSTSAGRSKACRWRSSWRRRGRACCRARQSPPNCGRALNCCTRPMPLTPARHASIEVVFEQSWRLLGAGRARRAGAPVGFSWRFLARSGARRGRLRRCRCWVRWPTSRCCARRAPASSCTRWCSSSPPLRLGDGPGACIDSTRAHARYFHRLMAQLRLVAEDGDREALQTDGR